MSRRINYAYLDRLLAALDHVGIDARELPNTFIRLAWQERLQFLRDKYDVPICARCKVPYLQEEMDTRYDLCSSCAETMHRKRAHDPRIADMLVHQYMPQLERTLAAKTDSNVSVQIAELTRKMPTPQSASDVLDRAAKRTKVDS